MKALVIILFLAIQSLCYCEPLIFDKQPIIRECSELPDSGFRIYLNLDTNYYLYGEPVWLTVRIVYEGKENDSISELNENDLLQNIIIKNGEGKILHYKGVTICSAVISYFCFAPGQDKIYHLEIRSVYGDKHNEDVAPLFDQRSRFSPGSYSLCVKKYNRNTQSFILSNFVYFNIIEPDETEKMNYSILDEVYEMMDYSRVDASSKKTAFKNVLEKIKGSSYYSEAFCTYINLRVFNKYYDFETVADDIIAFIGDNPNDYWCKNYIRYFYFAFLQNHGEKRIALDKLKELKESHPNTRLSVEIEDFLKSEQ